MLFSILAWSPWGMDVGAGRTRFSSIATVLQSKGRDPAAGVSEEARLSPRATAYECGSPQITT